MKALRSLSDWYRRLSARERRVVAVGATVSAVALAAAFVVLPLATRWSTREASIEAKREQLVRLDELIRREEAIQQSVEARRQARRGHAHRLLTGATPDVAASSLQELIQRYAIESDVNLDRFDAERARDVGGEESDPARPRVPADSLANLETIPVSMTAQGDVHGLVALLQRVQNGEKLLLIDDLRVSSFAAPEDGRQLLRWSLRLRAPFVTE
jgi:hypothetical protein